MRKIIEVTQTKCECRALITPQTRSYRVQAQVELTPAIGRRLLITVNPPLNSINEAHVVFDGSRLPEDMVADWLMEIIRPDQRLSEYDVISSDKEEHEIVIQN